MEANSIQEAEESPTLRAQDGQPSRGASIRSADLDRRPENLDTVAGSEFVDDRIRLEE